MTDDELMVAVWADPDCPVQLVDPDSWDGREGSVPWPRERIEIPARSDHAYKGYIWNHICRCRSNGSAKVWTDVDADATIKPMPQAIVTLNGRLWFEQGPTPQSHLVYVGQCEDCGRIYWSIVR